MNYLAHLYLSPADAESRAGNLMGDFRKYLNGQVLPERILLGIENHMRVDRFTDNHPVIREMKGLFSQERRRFAGIIVDIVADYFLIKHWQVFNDADLDGFVDNTYLDLQSMQEYMPARMRQVVNLMIGDDWLRSYASLSGVGRALDRISSRIRFDNRLVGVIGEVEENYPELESGFMAFFPELRDHVESER